MKRGPGYVPAETFEEFKERIRPYTGEIKGVLARGKFLAGIGNAYVDEILWAALDRRKKGWHDKIAGTVVVHEPD